MEDFVYEICVLTKQSQVQNWFKILQLNLCQSKLIDLNQMDSQRQNDAFKISVELKNYNKILNRESTTKTFIASTLLKKWVKSICSSRSYFFFNSTPAKNTHFWVKSLLRVSSDLSYRYTIETRVLTAQIWFSEV